LPPLVTPWYISWQAEAFSEPSSFSSLQKCSVNEFQPKPVVVKHNKKYDHPRAQLGPGSGSSRRRGALTRKKHKPIERKHMEEQTQTSNDMGTLAEDARALMAATADVAGDKVEEARKRLTGALEKAKEIAGRVGDVAIDRAKATDEVVREHPYQALGIAFGVGALMGCLLSRRGSRNGD